MTDISFYHLTVRPLLWALPRLLQRTLEAGERAVVMLPDHERLHALNMALWTHDPASWLPHGSEREGFADDQPIWLTLAEENPNGARFLFLVDSADCENVDRFARVFELFDGRNQDAVNVARTHWRMYRDAGHALSYWQQDQQGRWNKAA